MAKNTRDPANRRREENEHRRRVEEAEARSRAALSDREKRERVKIGAIGYAQGVGPGFGRGATKMADDLINLQILYGRLAYAPLDQLFSPPGQTAPDQVGRAILNAGANAVDYALHPSKLRSDLTGATRQTAAKLNPFIGYAPTVQEQKLRGYEAGKNGGEAVFNAVTLIEGGGQAKLLRNLGHVGKAPTLEHYLAKGATLKEARYMASPYTGKQGSHFVPQRTKLPGGVPIPKVLMDSPFNRIMPAPGAANGQMMKFHYGVDNRYHGGKISAQHGGGGWSGKRLGWEKSSAPVRWWRGMPLPTKIASYAGLAGLGSYIPED